MSSEHATDSYRKHIKSRATPDEEKKGDSALAGPTPISIVWE